MRYRSCLTYLYEAGAADQLFWVYNINQGFLYRHLLNTGHIKTIHVLPPWHKLEMAMGYISGVSNIINS